MVDSEHSLLKQSAIEDGDPYAQAYLADCYLNGDHGEPVDIDLAREFYLKAAAQQHEYAQEQLNELDSRKRQKTLESTSTSTPTPTPIPTPTQEMKTIHPLHCEQDSLELRANAQRLFEVVDGLMTRAQTLLSKLQTPGLDSTFVKNMKQQHDEILSHCMKLLHDTALQL